MSTRTHCIKHLIPESVAVDADIYGSLTEEQIREHNDKAHALALAYLRDTHADLVPGDIVHYGPADDYRNDGSFFY